MAASNRSTPWPRHTEKPGAVKRFATKTVEAAAEMALDTVASASRIRILIQIYNLEVLDTLGLAAAKASIFDR